MAKLTCEEFNKKWDKPAYDALMANNDNWEENYRKYIEDCFDMYETEGFCDTFKTPYQSIKKYNGMKFKVLRRATTDDGFDLETLPVWEIQYENGEKFMGFPEEICKIERKS